MGRRIVPYEPTWLDRTFKKEYDSLTPGEKQICMEILGELLEALERCGHPALDPALQRWRPSAYRGIVKVKAGHLVEYRLSGTMRVIACYFEDHEEILLVAATIKHDHERLKRLLRQHGRDLTPTF